MLRLHESGSLSRWEEIIVNIEENKKTITKVQRTDKISVTKEQSIPRYEKIEGRVRLVFTRVTRISRRELLGHPVTSERQLIDLFKMVHNNCPDSLCTCTFCGLAPSAHCQEGDC